MRRFIGFKVSDRQRFTKKRLRDCATVITITNADLTDHQVGVGLLMWLRFHGNAVHCVAIATLERVRGWKRRGEFMVENGGKGISGNKRRIGLWRGRDGWTEGGREGERRLLKQLAS